MIFIGFTERPFEFTWETGDEDWDDFVNRNIDIFIDALMLYGAYAFRKKYLEVVGVAFSRTLFSAIAGRWGSHIAGYYLSGIIDPDEGYAKWNRFQDRAYDWWGLEDYNVFGIGIDSILPNPIALAGIVGESVYNAMDYVTPLFEHSINIGFSHATSLILPSSTLDVRDLVSSSVPDHPWNAEPGWRHR